MKIPKITQKNVHIFIPLKAAFVASKRGSGKEATLRELAGFYKSQTYQLLEKESTKVWWEGPSAILDRYNQELSIQSRKLEGIPEPRSLQNE